MRRLILPVIASVFGAGLLGLLIYGVTHQSASRTLDEAVAHGKRPLAPEPSRILPALEGGGRGSLASYRGKVVILNFWASWCEPCQEEAPLLEDAEHKLRNDDATVLGVTYQDPTPDSRAFVRDHHLTYPNLRDVTGNFAHAYGTDQLPESFLIDRHGRVVEISRGEIGPGFVKNAVALARSQ